MKRPLVLLAAGLALVLGACTARRQRPPRPGGGHSGLDGGPSSGGAPIPDWMADQPAPAFLDAEQQALFLRAYSAASFSWAAPPAAWTAIPGRRRSAGAGDYETVTLDSGWTYLVAQGRYARWEDFRPCWTASSPRRTRRSCCGRRMGTGSDSPSSPPMGRAGHASWSWSGAAAWSMAGPMCRTPMSW
ncbi:MAG: hypothetical protein ACLRIS_07210 [Flavonifractor plautii]